MQSTARHTTANSSRSAHAIKTICVVDPQVSGDAGSLNLNTASDVRFEVVATAEQALRLARSQQIDQWVVNTTLPGLSGFELCGMLKARNSRAAVCLVANEYAIETERQAWAAKASMFVCKADATNWLQKLCDQFTGYGPTAVR